MLLQVVLYGDEGLLILPLGPMQLRELHARIRLVGSRPDGVAIGIDGARPVPDPLRGPPRVIVRTRVSRPLREQLVEVFQRLRGLALVETHPGVDHVSVEVVPELLSQLERAFVLLRQGEKLGMSQDALGSLVALQRTGPAESLRRLGEAPLLYEELGECRPRVGGREGVGDLGACAEQGLRALALPHGVHAPGELCTLDEGIGL
jgi:hypothetical protein